MKHRYRRYKLKVQEEQPGAFKLIERCGVMHLAHNSDINHAGVAVTTACGKTFDNLGTQRGTQWQQLDAGQPPARFTERQWVPRGWDNTAQLGMPEGVLQLKQLGYAACRVCRSTAKRLFYETKPNIRHMGYAEA